MATEQATTKHRWRPRFSLLALVLAVVFVGACGGLWWRWEPWAVVRLIEFPGPTDQGHFSPDGSGYWVCGKRSGFLKESASKPIKTGLLRMFDLETGVERFRAELPDSSAFLDVWPSPSGQSLALSNSDFFEIVDLTVGRRSMGSSAGQDRRLVCDGWGQALYVGCWTGTEVIFHHIESNRETRLEWPGFFPLDWRCSPDGKVLGVPGLEKRSEKRSYRFRVYDTSTWQPISMQLPEGYNPTSVGFSMDSRYMSVTNGLTTDEREGVLVLDCASGRLVSEAWGVCADYARFSEDGATLITSEQGQIRLIEADTGKTRVRLGGELGCVTADASYVVAGSLYCMDSRNWHAYVWDEHAGGESIELEHTAHTPMYGLVLTPHKRLLGGGVLWDTRTGAILREYEGRIYPTHDRHFGLAMNGATLEILEVETGNTLCSLGAAHGNVWADFSLDGQHLLTSGGSNCARLWHRRRPEYWWGIAWLPEFWIALLSGGALLVLAVRRLLTSKTPKQEAA